VTESVQISITSHKSEHEGLTVQDAMRQVWDFFDLLSNEANPHVHWILEDVKYNSPLVISAKPINIQTNELAYDLADPVVQDVASAIRDLVASKAPQVKLSDKKLEKIKHLLERNTNGIEKTEYYFGHEIEPAIIDQTIAESSLRLLEQPNELDALLKTFSYEGFGSVTGSLINIGKRYTKPIIYIKEFNSGNKLWCEVDQQTITELEEEIRAKDVWEQRDIVVQGMLNYDDNGKLTHIIDSKVSYLDRKHVSIEELHDPDFTEGLSSEQYLEKLRGG